MAHLYEHPPIIEALCEFHFDEQGIWDQTIPGRFFDKIQEPLPIIQPLTRMNMSITLAPGGMVPQIGTIPISRFSDTANVQIAQIGPHLLSVHHLQPYQTWDVFRGFILMCLKAYQAVAPSATLATIVLRYVNRIELSVMFDKLPAYFAFYPQLILDQGLPHDFMTGMHVPSEDGRNQLTVEMTGASGERQILIFLDIGYALMVPHAVALEDIANWLEEAHTRIGHAFEASISDALRHQFGEVNA